MTPLKTSIRLLLTLILTFAVLCSAAAAKTNPAGQTVGAVLFYVQSSAGQDILVAQIPVAAMEADLAAGLIDSTNHNYALLDRYVTTVHQEAQGFTVPEFVSYAQKKSTVPALRSLPLTFAGQDRIALWEIDQSGFDDRDTYTYTDLYGVSRYNFPLLYEYWDYSTQDYYDPAGQMTREQVIEHILVHAQPETALLSVRAYSQRYMVTDDKYAARDYNLENEWQARGLLDNQRTLRVMKPMTEAELRASTPTASDTRYWVANVRLSIENAPAITVQGAVAAPRGTMTEDGENYYLRFDCATPGAAIYYNHNYISPGYAPSNLYTGGSVAVPKSAFPDGVVTMTCRAVKDGYTDSGVTTLTLVSSGPESASRQTCADVAPDSWYYEYVEYVLENGLFDLTAAEAFSPESPMTRAMLATALYRLAGQPESGNRSAAPFDDVPAASNYAAAVAWCYEQGVVNGTSQTSFAPEATITREQITAMFHRYAAKVAGADMSAAADLARFTDAATLSPYAEGSMQWGVGAGLIDGMTPTTLGPHGTATRAQAAAMVVRLARSI